MYHPVGMNRSVEKRSARITHPIGMRPRFAWPHPYGIEAKETPVENHLKEFSRRAANIQADACFLAGRHPSAKFNQYVWGGVL